jgi:hypothetical protein
MGNPCGSNSWYTDHNTKESDIVKWAKEEQLALSKMDANSRYVASYIECTLLPKLNELQKQQPMLPSEYCSRGFMSDGKGGLKEIE